MHMKLPNLIAIPVSPGRPYQRPLEQHERSSSAESGAPGEGLSTSQKENGGLEQEGKEGGMGWCLELVEEEGFERCWT